MKSTRLKVLPETTSTASKNTETKESASGLEKGTAEINTENATKSKAKNVTRNAVAPIANAIEKIKDSATADRQRRKGRKKEQLAPNKLSLLFTVVNRSKSDYFVDYVAEYECNASFVLYGSGTAKNEILSKIGISYDTDKAVIISVIRQDREKDVLSGLDDKFRSVRGGKGVAFTTPMTSVIGVSVYKFLSNLK